MPMITWNQQMTIGIASIDHQHRKLVDLINQLADAMQAGKGKDALGTILKNLVSYTVVHFKYEEDLFAKSGYADRLSHIQAHANLVARVREIEARYNAGSGGVISIELLQFLKNWFTTHIMGTDKKYVPHLKANGVS